MGATSVSIEGVPVPRSSSGKPKKLIRGRRRTVLVKAIDHLQSLYNQENRENVKAAKLKYTPFLALGLPNSKMDKAFTTLLRGLQDARDAKA